VTRKATQLVIMGERYYSTCLDTCTHIHTHTHTHTHADF